MSVLTPENSGECERLAEQAHELFQQLKLNDPAVLRYYEMLEKLGRQQEPPPVWLRTNIHSVAPTV
jgi:hypothetical protein